MLQCFGNVNYEVRYYYDYLNPHINNMTWMPNTMVVGEYVLQFNYDMTQGIMVWDTEYSDGVLAQYREHKKNTIPLLKKADPGLDIINMYQFVTGGMLKSLFVEPCMSQCITSDILQEGLIDSPQKDILIKKMQGVVGKWNGNIYDHSALSNFNTGISCFQEKGLRNFMETGRIREFPEILYHPLREEIRLLVMKRMFGLVQQGWFIYRMVEDSIEIPENVIIYLTEEEKVLNLNHVNQENMSQIAIEEPGIFHAFVCFFEYLEKKGMLLGEKETMERMEQIYLEYAEKWKKEGKIKK